MNQQDATVDVLGGYDEEVEVNETEIGRKRNGVHGHSKQVLADVCGVFQRSNGHLWMTTFDKVQEHFDERRFGPPKLKEAMALFDHVATWL